MSPQLWSVAKSCSTTRPKQRTSWIWGRETSLWYWRRFEHIVLIIIVIFLASFLTCHGFSHDVMLFDSLELLQAQLLFLQSSRRFNWPYQFCRLQRNNVTLCTRWRTSVNDWHVFPEPYRYYVKETILRWLPWGTDNKATILGLTIW